MVNQNNKKLRSLACSKATGFGTGLIVCLLLFVLVSCASSPSAPKPEMYYQNRSGFALMAEGATLYFTAEVQEARPILDSLVFGGMSGAEIKDFLDMSDVLTAAIFQIPGELRYYAAASGKFPSASGGLFFSASKDWKKMTSAASGMPYWHSKRSLLSVSLTSKYAYLSNTDPFVPPPGARIPEALPGLQKGAVISGWLNNAAEAIGRLVAAFQIPAEIPAERLLFAIYPVGSSDTGGFRRTIPASEKEPQYSATLRFETSSATEAAALVLFFTLAKLRIAQADFSGNKEMEPLVKALFSNNPRRDGNALILETGIVNGKDIALLFNSFALY